MIPKKRTEKSNLTTSIRNVATVFVFLLAFVVAFPKTQEALAAVSLGGNAWYIPPSGGFSCATYFYDALADGSRHVNVCEENGQPLPNTILSNSATTFPFGNVVFTKVYTPSFYADGPDMFHGRGNNWFNGFQENSNGGFRLMYIAYNVATDKDGDINLNCLNSGAGISARCRYWNPVKESICPAGQVMTGTALYEFATDVDDEHQDARCAPISGAWFGTPYWVEAPNAFSGPAGWYKDALCGNNEVMLGIRMFGIYSKVDTEHIDVLCARIFGTGLHAPYWVEAPNAFAAVYGDYKYAVCKPGDIMIGARWYEWLGDMDEEHTDAKCASPDRSVQLNFSFLKELFSNYF